MVALRVQDSTLTRIPASVQNQVSLTMANYGSENTNVFGGVLMRFPSEMPSVKDGKEWVRVVRTLLKSEWRALVDGAELRQLIPYRDT